jgi:hypothetical protein
MPDLNNDSKTLGKVMDGLAGNFPGELACDKTPYAVTFLVMSTGSGLSVTTSISMLWRNLSRKPLYFFQ